MEIFKVGDKARIVDMPDKDKGLVGEEVTIVPAGGFGVETDDMCVRTGTGMMLYVNKSQLRRI